MKKVCVKEILQVYTNICIFVVMHAKKKKKKTNIPVYPIELYVIATS